MIKALSKPELDEAKLFVKQHCIALTGSIATGKSTVASILGELGYRVIDVDQISRQVVGPGSRALEQIKMLFGPEVILPNSQLNRDVMRQKILADPNQKKRLEDLLHPLILQEFLSQAIDIKKSSSPNNIFFYEASLIFENNRQNDFKSVWATTCSEKTQLQRVIARSNGKISHAEALSLVKSQLSAAQKSAMADWVINTELDLNDIKAVLETRLKSLI